MSRAGEHDPAEVYEPPLVDDVTTKEGPAVTAAGISGDQRAAEWRGAEYQAPEVEDIPASDGPAETATAVTGMF